MPACILPASGTHTQSVGVSVISGSATSTTTHTCAVTRGSTTTHLLLLPPTATATPGLASEPYFVCAIGLQLHTKYQTKKKKKKKNKKELQQRVVFQQHAALIGGPNATSCPVCHKLFLGAEALMEHMKHTHKDPNASGVASKYDNTQKRFFDDWQSNDIFSSSHTFSPAPDI